jgi:hypothetical protein
MKSFHDLVQIRAGGGRLRSCLGAILAAVLLAFSPGLTGVARAQVVPSGDAGGARLAAGGTFSGYNLSYGSVKVMGGTAFVDSDTLLHIGFEGEARWLTLHLPSDQNGPGADEQAETYLIGPRYSRFYGRFQPYVKALIGGGHFNYPYNFASENDLVVAPGAGLDYRITRRIRWRAVDFEYQFWPQFNFGQMTSYGLSSGLKIKIF